MNKMRQTFSIYAVAALLAVAAAIYAQDSRSHGEQQSATTQERQKKERELKELNEERTVAVVDGDIRVFTFVEPLEYKIADKPIKGAPFSAQVVSENTQTLANGVHISSKSAGMLYRDSDGRTRSEEPRDGDPEMVLINDPIAGVSYRLHMFNHTAVKVKYDSLEGNRKVEELKAEIEHRHSEMEHKRMTEGEVVDARSRQLHSGVANKVELAITERQLTEDRELGRERKVESLGTQTVEGVQAVGTRVTFTFAAGTEGNDQSFDIVHEKWYSADLQMVVMTRHSDPRSGDHVYRLTNINRSEPARSLFEAPSDFALKEEKAGLRRK